MDKHNCNQPWDQGMFETGRTRPPKNHNGVIALLLVTVVCLYAAVRRDERAEDYCCD